MFDPMLRKLLIRVWIGPLPSWYEQWCEHVKTLARFGFDFLVVNDYDWFKRRCKDTLGIDVNVIPGTRKAGDFDPAYGVIFAKELEGYDFWGHTGLDVVFGRLDRFLPDEFLSGLDIFGNDPDAICGPFSLYRNCRTVNNLFMRCPDWRSILESPTLYAFDEDHMTGLVRAAAAAREIRFGSAFWQSHDAQAGHVPTPQMSLLEDGALYDRVKQQPTMMFHFHKYRQWPVS